MESYILVELVVDGFDNIPHYDFKGIYPNYADILKEYKVTKVKEYNNYIDLEVELGKFTHVNYRAYIYRGITYRREDGKNDLELSRFGGR